MSGVHQRNALSMLGRMSYGVHLLLYPTVVASYFWGLKPFLARRAEAAKKEDWERIPKAKVVDPDNFSAYTPIPYHNNPELKYAYAHLNMFNYVNANHLNVRDYTWRLYHNVYDHDNENAYLYNWSSISTNNH